MQKEQKLKWSVANPAACVGGGGGAAAVVDIIFSIKSYYVSDDSKILAISGVYTLAERKSNVKNNNDRKKLYSKKKTQI